MPSILQQSNHVPTRTDVNATIERAHQRVYDETERQVKEVIEASVASRQPITQDDAVAMAEKIAQKVADLSAEGMKEESESAGGFATVETLSNFALMVPIVATSTVILDTLITSSEAALSTNWVAFYVSAFAALLLTVVTWSELPTASRSFMRAFLLFGLLVFNTLILSATALGIGKFVESAATT